MAGADGVTISGAEASPTSPAAITGGIAGAGLTVDNLTVDGGLTFTAGDNTVSRSRVMSTGIGVHDVEVTVSRSAISSGGISAEPGSVTVSDSTISGGGVAAIFGTATVSDSTISGGGVAASYGTATVSHSAISGNMGDGISIYQGSVSVSGSTISGNTGDGIDGNPWSGITVANSTISGNGFGIEAVFGFSLSDTTISGNRGGGISAMYGPLNVTDSAVSDNGGAGITMSGCYVPGPCALTVSGSTVIDNSGDGIDAASIATVSASSILGNAGVGLRAGFGALVSASTVSDNRGGGLYVDGGRAGPDLQPGQAGGDIEVSGSTISGNTAPDGGGMYICDCGGLPSDIVISGNTVTGNSATDGGGIYIADLFGSISSPFGATISDNTISANTATDGGGIYNVANVTFSPALISDNTITANTVGEGGGGIYNVGNVAIALSTFSGNVAPQGNVVDNAAVPAPDRSTVLAVADIFDGSCQNQGAWNDGGYNVSSDGTCLAGGAGDVNYGSSLSEAGLLGPLVQNGGPTETMLPLAGNPAVELVPSGTSVVLDGASVSLCPVTDQRGVASLPGLACTAGSVQVVPTTLQLSISAPYQDNGVTVVSLWWAAPPGATSFSMTVNESTGIGPYSYTAIGLPQYGPGTSFIVQVEGATPMFGATFQVADNLGDVSNTVSY